LNSWGDKSHLYLSISTAIERRGQGRQRIRSHGWVPA
jgi:hypothetical protein